MAARLALRLWWAAAFLVALTLALAIIPRVAGRSASALNPENGMVCSTGPQFNLRASDGYIITPDGNSVYMWSYQGSSSQFQYPGPVLCVNQGDTVTVQLDNDLPEPVSMVFLGQEGVEADAGVDFQMAQPQFDVSGKLTSLTTAAPPGGSVTYRFVAKEPGTFIYESGTNPHKQVQMGLIGALIVRPALGASFAYNDPVTEFNPEREFLLLFHEIDPALHQAVELGQPYNVTQLHFRYWTVNGRSFTDTILPNNTPTLPAQPYGALVQIEPYDPQSNSLPALVRMANPGMANHPFHPHGQHVLVVAQDGRLRQGPLGQDAFLERFTRTTGSGQTFDALFWWTDVEGWDPAFNPVPVEVPGLLNLVFADDATFYAGNVFLGLQGELPVGVTSFNQCGEQYFPWHSHALFEFQNFDEGFGGLATLLRVDPPGGCQ